MEWLLYLIAGATVGLAVGMTGVGGGSIMTPLLLAFGFPLHIAVGTDLLYAAITKTGGSIVHQRQNNIEWRLVALIASGSIPATLLTIYFLHTWFSSSSNYASLISNTLGFALILTAGVVLIRARLNNFMGSSNLVQPINAKAITPLMGAILGIMVTLSSVGAGALATALILVLYPHLKGIKVVGTDIAHAVPLTLIAGLGHWYLGNVDFALLLALITGSLPAVHLGAKIGKQIPHSMLQHILAAILLGTGIKVIFF